MALYSVSVTALRATLLPLLSLGALSCSAPPGDPQPASLGPAFDVVIPDVSPLDSTPLEDVEFDLGPCEGIEEGGACDDGNICTTGDTCVSGFCVPGAAMACGESLDPCTNTVCLPDAGCTEILSADGAQCQLPCYASGRCESGTCIVDPETETVCPLPADPCVSAIACNPIDGECSIKVYALSCPAGMACRERDGLLECATMHPLLCRPCHVDGDCTNSGFLSQQNQCLDYGDAGRFCGGDCTTEPCPDGYACMMPDDGGSSPQCIAVNSTCTCQPEWSSLGYETTCSRSNEWGTCEGQRYCLVGGLTPCSAALPSEEVCDGVDNDCDGQTDFEDGCGPAGACCLGIGECVMSYKISCALQGGTFQGIGVACNGAACGGSTLGACCRPDGTCTEHTLAVCLSLEGQYLGDGSICDGVSCTDLPGVSACCRPDGACSTTTPVNCTLSGGTYQGSATACSELQCPILGACCTADTTCLEISGVECSEIFGDFSQGQTCNETSCLLPPGVGACCLDGGSCAVLDISTCSGQALEGEMCVGQCDAPTLGACCAPLQQGCTEVPIQECPANHQWKGPSTVCADACIETTGICCISSNCYPGLTLPQCDAVNGEFAGPDATCDACE